ncbi:MAG: response regulator [Cyclobacteriaceae bacterium]|nr:response regulator [Cyclobacteriaceae bacterium]MCH8517511.1 response regulator [Cyclobacteriaceae bacterium]
MAKKILIADDSMFQRKFYADVVESMSYHYELVKNGREALEALDAGLYDLLILDLLMPEVDGIEVLKSLRDKQSSVPILVISANIQESIKNQCNELGAAGFINKPAKKDKVIEQIQAILR